MRYFLLVLILIFNSCNKKSAKSDFTYLGGEIINPNNRYVLLHKNDMVIDSVTLDDQNRFLLKLENPEGGLYYFTHSPEEQYVYIEPGDSILWRLNTLEFDESLIFSGTGSEINNFLIEMFLVNEDEEELVYDYYKLDPDTFTSKLDSLRQMKEEQYEALVQSGSCSKNALKIARASIDFVNYKQKELYPYMHKKRLMLEDYSELPKDFHKYRESVNLNENDLCYFSPYFRYCTMYFNNLAYTECIDECASLEQPERSIHYHTHKLKLIDSLISLGPLRSILFRNAAYSYLFDHHDPAHNERYIETFNTIVKDPSFCEDVNTLYDNIQSIQPGNRLPKLEVTNTRGEYVELNDTGGKKTVYYFWSLNQKSHFKHTLKRIAKLQEKNPDYRFIGVNLNDSPERWLNALKQYGLEASEAQLHANNTHMKVSKKLVIRNMNKAIILDENGTIINAFANLNNKYFPREKRY